MIYDQNELQSAIEDGERRLAQKRQQRRAQKKRLIFAAVLAGALGLYGLAAAIVWTMAPGAPLLVVTWPKPKIRQVLAPGQTVLSRAGQPFNVEVTDAENWEVKWRAAGIESSGGDFSWAPAREGGELSASCRARTGGWRSFFVWTWPRREVVLQATVARKIGDYGRAVEAGKGTWVYPHVFASGKISFDERALPALSLASQELPASQLASQLAPIAESASVPVWNLVADFEGGAPKSFADPRENGTFASLQRADVETQLPRIAGEIAQKSPTASVKFVLRLDKKPPIGVLRLAFDGKGTRQAFVRRAGESAGGPLTGWEGGATRPGLPPSLPAN